MGISGFCLTLSLINLAGDHCRMRLFDAGDQDCPVNSQARGCPRTLESSGIGLI
jgi:hypothetical protein